MPGSSPAAMTTVDGAVRLARGVRSIRGQAASPQPVPGAQHVHVLLGSARVAPVEDLRVAHVPEVDQQDGEAVTVEHAGRQEEHRVVAAAALAVDQDHGRGVGRGRPAPTTPRGRRRPGSRSGPPGSRASRTAPCRSRLRVKASETPAVPNDAGVYSANRGDPSSKVPQCGRGRSRPCRTAASWRPRTPACRPRRRHPGATATTRRPDIDDLLPPRLRGTRPDRRRAVPLASRRRSPPLTGAAAPGPAAGPGRRARDRARAAPPAAAAAADGAPAPRGAAGRPRRPRRAAAPRRSPRGAPRAATSRTSR